MERQASHRLRTDALAAEEVFTKEVNRLQAAISRGNASAHARRRSSTRCARRACRSRRFVCARQQSRLQLVQVAAAQTEREQQDARLLAFVMGAHERLGIGYASEDAPCAVRLIAESEPGSAAADRVVRPRHHQARPQSAAA